MPWALLIEMAFEFMMENCDQKRDRAAIEAGLNDPGPQEAIAIRRVMRRYFRDEKGLRRKKLRKRVKAETQVAFAKLQAMPRRAVAAMMDEFEETCAA